MTVQDEQERSAMLSDGERRLREALDASPDGFAVYRICRDGSGALEALPLDFINAAGAAGFEGDAHDILGQDLRGFFPVSVESGLWAAAAAAADADGDVSVRIETDGPSWPGTLDVRWVRLGDDRLLSTWRDVTQDMASRRETAEARATLQTALDATSDAFAVYALDHGDGTADGTVRLRMLMANVAAAAPTGLTPAEMVGLDVRDFFPQAERSGLWGAILESVAARAPRHVRIHVVDEADGRWLTSWDNTIAPVGQERVVLTWRNATEDERTVRTLARAHDDAVHSATHDHLTGLPNRKLLQERLTEALAQPGPERIAVVFVDLDDFKDVNDTWGHATGDDVLRTVGNRLQRLVRHEDTPARLGGDEFVILLRHLGPDWDAGHFVHRVQALVSAPVPVSGGRGVLHPGASVGIALCPPAGADAQALLGLADAAMYRAKTRRREARRQDALSG